MVSTMGAVRQTPVGQNPGYARPNRASITNRTNTHLIARTLFDPGQRRNSASEPECKSCLRARKVDGHSKLHGNSLKLRR
jgi:hypothetical protein